MKPTPFNPETDLPPIPFDPRHCQAAAQLKEKGLSWIPHVGCFVWDPDEIIEVTSPFPDRIYFILNLGHFLRIFGSLEEISEKLVWLPTYHQTRLLLEQVGVEPEEVSALLASKKIIHAGDELLMLYKLILNEL